MQYLVIRTTEKGKKKYDVISDPVAFYNSGKFNSETDTIFQIGNEIKIKVVADVQPNQRKAL